MSIDSTSPSTLEGRVTVPWSTVVPLAVVMAYADGFWTTTLRGAVGAIERSQQPFAGWWRESTLTLPIFLFAVLGASTLALRRFGPAARRRGTTAVTAMLIAAAGTIAGIALMIASSAYDYHLQSTQLAMMNSLHSLCAHSCLAQQQQSTLAAHIRGVGYTSGLLLATNLVLVGWVVAMKGGRLEVSANRRQSFDTNNTGHRTPDRGGDIRGLLIAALVSSAAIHAAVIPAHFSAWTAGGVFFIVLAAAELAVAGMLLTRPHRTVLYAAVLVSVGPLALWLYSRTAGLPFGPGAGRPESIGLPDIIAVAMEIGALIAAAALLRTTGWLHRRPPATAHTRSLRLVAVVAVTAIGLAGTAPTWFDGSGNNAGTHAVANPH